MSTLTENQYDLTSQALDAIDAMKSDVAVAIMKNMRQFHFLRRNIEDVGYELLNTEHLIDCVNEQIDDMFDESAKELRAKVKEFQSFDNRVFRQENATRPL